MKKIILVGALTLGILGTVAASTNVIDQAGYPTQHSPSFTQTEVALGGYQTLGYPTQH
ncbi:hypothetical protein [Cytobacillus pseudoceanisediminis]|uniref:hypothetical protein n=1 Tax=Cytobacillus pseudoceanisediminis TaxID=3051614 RepID=UPI003C305972